jgi:site-specific DNA-cytosine methylase
MNLDNIKEKKLPLRVGSVCSGIGGFDLAFMQAGFEVVWACEIDREARETLRFHLPDQVIYDDITKLRSIEGIEGIDVLCGGTPCQSFSIAVGNAAFPQMGRRQAVNPAGLAGKNAGALPDISGTFHWRWCAIFCRPTWASLPE